MAIAHALGQLGATLLTMLHTRLALAAVELEEESRRFLGYLILGLLSLFLFGLAVALLALFVIVLFWDNYRLQAIGGMALLFGVAGAAVALRIQASFAAKPRLMGETVAELGKDLALLRRPGGEHG